MTGVASAASAHDEIVDTTPDNGTSLEQPPSKVVIEFATAPESGQARVTGPDEKGNLARRPEVRGRKLTVPLRSARTPGWYQVRFNVTAGDGHRVTGSLEFEVARTSADPTPATGEGTPTPEAGTDTPAAPPPETSTSESTSTPLLLAAGGLIAAAGVGLAWWLTHRRGAST